MAYQKKDWWQYKDKQNNIVNPTDREDGMPSWINGRGNDGKWRKVDETTVDGMKVNVITKNGRERYLMFSDGSTMRFDAPSLSKKKKVAEMREAEAKSDAQAEADRIKDQRQQAEAEIKAEKEYQQGKREEAEKEQQKYADIVGSVWGDGGKPTINGFAQTALEAANAYAEQKAREQAQDVAATSAEKASNQAMQAAVNAGMSPAQAALFGGRSATAYADAYGSTYQNTFDNQQQSYLGKQTEGLGVAQQQQNREDRNANTATQNMYQQNNRQDDYLGVAQQEREYFNTLSQQELQKHLQYYQQQLNAAQAGIKTITGLLKAGASLAGGGL